MGLQPIAWCWAGNSGWKWHNGVQVEGVAPEIADSELPLELTAIADCDAGTISIEKGGALLGGTFLYDGLQGGSAGLGLDLRLAIGTYDDACRVTIVSYTHTLPE